MRTEQRSRPRRAKMIPVSFGGEFAITEDVSERAVRIRTAGIFAVGTRTKVELELASGCVAAQGVVVRTSECQSDLALTIQSCVVVLDKPVRELN